MSDQVFFVSPAELAAWRDAGDAVIVDVREPHEYEQAHIAGATLLPLSSFDAARIPAADGKHLVFHCRSGVRCGLAAERAVAAGFTERIARLEGGILAWMRDGHAVERG